MNERFHISILLVSVLTLLAGCTSEPQIVEHRIHKDRSGLEKLRQSDPLAQSTGSQVSVVQETRMAVAIFQNPKATWFFKVNGPAAQVAKTEDQWKSFFKSVKFENGEPTWDNPENWSKAGPKPMRHTTLLIGDDQPPLELAISSLGPDQPLLLNVNRWRGQIGLSPATEEELDDQVQELESDGGKYLVFDATGTGSGSMRPPFAGGAPFAGGGAPFAGGGAPFAGGGAKSKSSKLAYETPDGWSEGPTSTIVHARLMKKVDDAKVQITIVEMAADKNEWEPNVARWAKEVSMGSLSSEKMAERISELTVDGVAGKQVDLVDLESDFPLATIAGMVKRDGSVWFLKLTGDKELVELSRETFETFLGSLRFN